MGLAQARPNSGSPQLYSFALRGRRYTPPSPGQAAAMATRPEPALQPRPDQNLGKNAASDASVAVAGGYGARCGRGLASIVHYWEHGTRPR